MSPKKIYEAIRWFWDKLVPAAIFHLLVLAAAVYALELSLPPLDLASARLDSESILALLAFIRDYELWPVVGFAVPFVLVFYLFLFERAARLCHHLPIPLLRFQWTEPTFWYDAKAYQDLTHLAAYSPREINAFPDLADLHSSYLDRYRKERPETYTSYTEAPERSFRHCLFAMQLSLLFAIIVVGLFLLTSWQAAFNPFMAGKVLLLLAMSVCAFIALRYKGEQMIERKLQAEMAFVIASLRGDPKAKPRTETELEPVEQKVAQLMVMPQPYISRQNLWISRHLGQYRPVRWLLGKPVYDKPDDLTLRLLLLTAGRDFIEQLRKAGVWTGR